MPVRRSVVPTLTAAALVVAGAAPPAGAALAADVPDRTGYALTEAGWDGTDARTVTVDAREASRTVSFLATVRDPAGRVADDALALGFVRSAARVPLPTLPTPRTALSPGRASFALPVAKGSQDLEVAVPRHPAVTEAFAPGGDAAARVTARLIARATTTAVTTTRRVPPGARVSVRGRLDGRAGDPTGTLVRVQLRRAGAWRTIATAAVGADVRWRAAVRLPRAVRGRARLRAVVLPSATCPYARGASTSLEIAVR